MSRTLALTLLLAAAPALAVPPDLHRRENLDYRLFLGRLDGAENAAPLSDDGHHYSLGAGASSPIGLNGALEANLEAWLSERAYSGPFPNIADHATLTALSLSYGLRLRPPRGPWLPYAMGGVGFQATRLRSAGTLASGETLREEILGPTLLLGIGIEWRHGRESYGIDYRRSFAEGDFRVFGIDGAELGGEFLGISLGSAW